MEKSTPPLSRTELIKLFTRWNAEAAEKKWPHDNPNAEGQADHFLELASQIAG